MAGRGEDGPPRDWERSWSIDEMRTKSGDWSLASDAGMLLYLQEFSQKIVSRTHSIQEEVNGLVHEVKLSGVRVSNVFNDFIMLANTQFVENRVYDDDVSEGTTQDKKEEPEKTKEQKDAELIAQVSEAIKSGMNVMEQAFEKLDIHVNEADSDSDEDGAETRYKTDAILEAKDPYINRPLPHLIGSTAFYQTDDVGLVEESTDDESIAASVSESSESESESEEEIKPRPSKHVDSDTGSESSGSNLFDEKEPNGEFLSESEKTDSESDIDDDVKKDELTEPQQPPNFSDELTAKLGGGVPPPSMSKKKSKKPAQQETPTEDNDTGLFGSSNRTDDYDDEFGAQDGGLFSTKGGLFDDDVEEGGGLFGDIGSSTKSASKKREPSPLEAGEQEVAPAPKEKEKRKKKEPSRPKASAFLDDGDEDDGDLFGTKKTQDKKPKTRDVSALFDDGSDNDDLFASMSSDNSQYKQPARSSKPGKAALLVASDEEDGDLFNDLPSRKPSDPHTDSLPKASQQDKPKRLPPGAVPMFGAEANPFSAAIKAQRKDTPSESEDSSVEGDEEYDEREKAPVTNYKQKVVEPTTRSLEKQPDSSKPSSYSSMFADDDLFTSSKPKQQSISRSASKNPPPGPSLFASDDEDENDLFASLSQPVKPSSTNPAQKTTPRQPKKLLVDSDQEGGGDLFGSPAAARPASQPTKKKPVGGVSIFGDNFKLPGNKQVEVQQSDSDDFSEEEQKPQVIKKQPAPQNTEGPLLVSHEEDDLFASSSSSKPVKKKPAGGVSMFGENFTPPVADKTNQNQIEPRVAPPAQAAPLSLFDDSGEEDGLFDGGMPSSLRQESPAKASGSTPTNSSLYGGQDDLFGSSTHEEDDLFKPSPPKPKSTKSSAPKPVSSPPPVFGSPDEDHEDDIFPSLSAKPKVPKRSVPAPKPSLPPKSSTFQKPHKHSERPTTVPKLDTVKSYIREEADSDPLGIGVPVSAGKPDKPSPVGQEHAGPTISIVKPVGPPGRSTGVSKTKATLNINPTALLPGSRPPTKAAEPAPVAFEDDPASKTLEHLGKTRAKIQTKRRPPSRRARQGTTEPASEPDAATRVPSSLSNHIPDEQSSGAHIPYVPPAGSLSTQTREQDQPSAQASALFDDPLFTQDDNTNDIFGSAKPSDTKGATVGSKPGEKEEPDVTDSLHNGLSSKSAGDDKKPAPPKPAAPSENHLFDDPFGESIAKTNDMFGTTPKEVSKGLTVDGENDSLFAPTSRTSLGNSHTKPAAGLDDDDDMFGYREKPPPFTAASVFEDDDDDDIFGIKSSKQQAKNSSKGLDDEDLFPGGSKTLSMPKKQADDTDGLFEDGLKSTPPPLTAEVRKMPAMQVPADIDEDDIFSSKPQTKKPSSKKAVPLKDEDIFADDTDIFVDTPSFKPKEKTQKKKGSGKSSIFAGDVDDIFSDVPTKPKKTTTKKAATPKKPPAGDSGNIFSDPLQDDDDIFK